MGPASRRRRRPLRTRRVAAFEPRSAQKIGSAGNRSGFMARDYSDPLTLVSDAADSRRARTA